MKRPTAIKVLIIIELFIAVLGLATGLSLLSDPSGKALGLDVLKDKIPFQNLSEYCSLIPLHNLLNYC